MKKEQLELLLISAGLAKKEALIYLYLLENGPSKALKIVKNLKFKKGNTYALLGSLIKKGFISKKGTVFEAQPPLTLLQKLEEKSKELQVSLKNFKTLLPQLSSIYKLSIGKPTIRYFEGQEGVREAFGDVYSTKDKYIWGCVDIEIAEKGLKNYILPNLKPRRIKKKIWAISFSALSKTALELLKKDKQEYRKQILLERKKYPLPAEIDIYEDKIAMMSFRKGDFIGIIIENKDFAQSLRSVFKYAFKHLYTEKE